MWYLIVSIPDPCYLSYFLNGGMLQTLLKYAYAWYLLTKIEFIEGMKNCGFLGHRHGKRKRTKHLRIFVNTCMNAKGNDPLGESIGWSVPVWSIKIHSLFVSSINSILVNKDHVLAY